VPAILPAQDIICAQSPDVKKLSPSDPMRRMMMRASQMDFEHPDSAPERELNEMIWKSVKGPDSKMPEPHHTVVPVEKDND